MSDTTPEYNISLGGSTIGVAMFGLVEFIRTRPALRAVVAILGLIVAILSLAAIAGTKIIFISQIFGTFTLIFVAPWFLWAAVVSGPRFRLFLSFAPEKAQEERREAEQQFGDSKAPEDALKVDLARLNEYYVMNQSQVRSSFRWAKFSMIIGFLTIIIGIWLFYFRQGQPDKFMASISIAAGCVVNLVSGLFFVLCFKMQERSTVYYEQLSQMQKLFVAIRMVDDYQEPERTEARNVVLQELLRPRRVESLLKAKP